MGVRVIAEAATCHGGDYDEAIRLVHAAKVAGADVVKFQLIDPYKLYRPWVESEGVRTPNPVIEQRLLEVLPKSAWIEIANASRESGIECAFTVFDLDALSFVAELDVPFVKIASGDLTYIPLLEAAGSSSKPVILSTGMGTMQEVETALSALTRFGDTGVSLMHCVSIYPCPPERANLRRIEALKKFGLPVGYSDHTLGSWASVAAVALGSVTLEKHFRRSSGPRTVDWDHSLDELEFAKYVNDVRHLAASLTTSGIDVSEDEMATRLRARRGVYASRDLAKSHVMSSEDLLLVRPTTSLPLTDTNLVTGKTLLRDIASGEEIGWDCLN